MMMSHVPFFAIASKHVGPAGEHVRDDVVRPHERLVRDLAGREHRDAVDVEVLLVEAPGDIAVVLLVPLEYGIRHVADLRLCRLLLRRRSVQERDTRDERNECGALHGATPEMRVRLAKNQWAGRLFP